MDIKIIIIIVLIVLIIYSTLKKDEKNDKQFDSLLSEINKRIKNTLQSAGYPINYTLHNHKTASFTQNKKDVFICTECNKDNKTDLEKLVYVGLHEAAHILSKSKDHTNEWKNIFSILLYRAADLGYLQHDKILI